MNRYPSDIAFTSSVKSIQTARGSRASYAQLEQKGGWETSVTPVLAEFLASADMFYLGTANANGQPYIQYRGGPPGFLKIIDEETLAFADFSGNQQFITLGNLADNSQAFIFLIDYANRRRIKLWGTARVIEDDPALVASLSDPSYPARVERAIVFKLKTWNANCPQHIHQRVLASTQQPMIEHLRLRVSQLEKELEQLRSSMRKK